METEREGREAGIWVERSCPGMAARLELLLWGSDEGTLENAARAAFRELEFLDRLLSRFIGESEISIINALASRRAVPVEPTTFALIQRAVRYSQWTGGAFDITVAPLLWTWGIWDARGRGRTPTDDEITEALESVGWNRIVLDAGEGKVSFSSPGMALDLGAIGKGFAIDRVAGLLAEWGVTRGLVSFSGSSIYAMGPSRTGGEWEIDVENPLRRDEVLTRIRVQDAAVSSSGIGRATGREARIPHIINPRSGKPVEGGPVAVTVTAPTAEVAEVLSTALLVDPRDPARLLRNFNAFEALIVYAKGDTPLWERFTPEGREPGG